MITNIKECFLLNMFTSYNSFSPSTIFVELLCEPLFGNKTVNKTDAILAIVMPTFKWKIQKNKQTKKANKQTTCQGMISSMEKN